MNSNNNEINRLESISDFYAKGDVFDNLILDREVELIRRFCASKKNALEIGCGSGYSTSRLFNNYKEYEIIEPSQGNVNLLKSRINDADIKIHNCLIEGFVSEKKFDNIIFLNVIEHVENPVEALRVCYKNVSDEGLIYISAPNCMSLNRRAGYKLGLLESYDTFAEKDYLLGHRRLYTVDMLKEHCELANLKVVDIKGIYLKPLSERQMLDLGIDVIRAFYSLGEDIPEYCANLFCVAEKKY